MVLACAKLVVSCICHNLSRFAVNTRLLVAGKSIRGFSASP